MPAPHLVPDVVFTAAARHPDKTALIEGPRRLTYAELAQASRQFAGALRARGVKRGDRVVVFLPNGVDLVVALLGSLSAGAVFVPVHPQTKAAKLGYILRDTGATALCAPSALSSIWRAGIEASGLAPQIFVPGDGGWQGPAVDSDAIDLDLAAIIYTSGTTGQPKGVMLSHRNMLAAAGAVSAYLQLQPDDVIACVLPMCFSYGLYQPLLAALAGATVLIEAGFTFPVKVLEAMQREGATVFPAVPAIYAALLELSPGTLDRFDLSRLRLFTNAAAALPLAHIQALRARFPQVALCSMYGQTECKRISYLDPAQIDRRPDSVGRGIPNQQLFLLRDDGQLVDTRAGAASGQLVVRGSHVMRGYWGKPAETAAKLREGLLPGENLLLTGDLFRTDDEGYLYFVGRTDDIIKSRGEKVSPLEVENALHALPGVAHAAVIGVPDALLGEAIKAFVVLAPGATLSERDVTKHCLHSLENYMVPKHVSFVASLPMTGSGKVDKSALKKEKEIS